MSRIVTKSFEVPAIRFTEVKSVDIGAGLHAFERRSLFAEMLSDGSHRPHDEDVWDGIVDDEGLAMMLEGQRYEDYVPYLAHHHYTLRPMMVAERVLGVLREEGSVVSSSPLNAALVSAGELVMPGRRSFVQAASKGMTADNLLFFSSGDYLIVDMSGRPVPVAITFDYLDGGLDEEQYDIDAVAAHLAENPEITFLGEGLSRSGVSEVPYYNAYDGRERQVKFIWRPSDESWADLLQKAGFDEKNPKHVSLRQDRIVTELDLFSISAFRRDSQGYSR